MTRSGRCLMGVLLLGTIGAVYAPTAGHEFLKFDDDVYVTENPYIQGGITAAGVRWALTATHAANWHPLTWLSHMADVHWFGLKPAGHHLVSVLFHTLNSLLLLWVLYRMTGHYGRSLFVAALFALHPLHVESVAWIAERKDVLSTFFWLLTMLAYVRYTKRPGVLRYLPVVVCLALGLMAKPMVVSLPLVLLLLDYWPLNRLSPIDGVTAGHVFSVAGPRLTSGANAPTTRPGEPPAVPTSLGSLVLEKLPLLAMAAVSSGLTFYAQQQGQSMSDLQRLALWPRVANAAVSYVKYMEMMVWPTGLAAFYPHPKNTLPGWQVGGAAVVLAVISVLVIRQRRDRYLLTGWLWYLVTLVPVIGLVQVGAQAIADRYTYIPLIGLFVAFAWGLAACLERAGRAGRVLGTNGACAVLAVLAVLARVQVGYWHDPISLFTHALAVTQENFIAHNNLGSALMRGGRYDEAAVHFAEALRIRPGIPQAHFSLGCIRHRQGKLDEAEEHLTLAVEKMPAQFYIYHYELGAVLLEKGKREPAVRQLTLALELNPDDPDTYSLLGNALLGLGRREEAAAYLAEAVRLNPVQADARSLLGVALAQQGKLDEAARELARALETSPDSAEIHNNLGVVLQKQGKLEEAAAHYLAAVGLKPDYAGAHDNLAVTLFLQGNFADAWRAVHECRRYGGTERPGLAASLSAKMPEPKD